MNLMFGLVCMLTITGFCMGVATSKVVVRCIEQERQALVNFKQGIKEQRSDSPLSWEDEDCCLWKGIGCDNQTGHVTMLSLQAANPRDTNWTGEISPSLLELQFLNHLDLSNNNFSSRPRFPEFIGMFTNLTYLNLSSCGFRGSIPNTFGNLSSLLSLDLSYNSDLEMDSLDWIPHLSSLTNLRMSYLKLDRAVDWLQSIKKSPSLSIVDLSHCQFPEIVPSSAPHIKSSKSLSVVDLSSSKLSSSVLSLLFSISSSLIHLRLFNCSLNGQVPDTFGNMTSLSHLDLSSNFLQGGIPKSLGDLCNLQSLDLSSNNLSQQISETLLNLMGCAQDSLMILRLSRNQLKGSLPSQVARFSSLQELYLDSNQLNGSLPESLGNLSSLRVLVASSNSFSGVLSEAHLSNLSNLKQLDFSFNSLLTPNVSSTWVPTSQLDIIRLASCKLGPHFPSWLRAQKGFSELDISNSQISHPIPEWFWTILSSKLLYLNLSFNHIPGTVPKLESRKFFFYPTVDLSSNLFNGPIPPFLLRTMLLNLSKNMFSGSITSLLCNMKVGQGMNYLDLSDNQLSGYLPDCWFRLNETLSVLSLENNNFSGTIPTSMGSLSQLQTLCLRNNNFSGQLSLSLKGWRRLKLLDIGDNYFSGKIPSWIGESLKGLVVLRLSSNGFDGDIPLNICYLQSLRVLDLSLNKISGSIPSCLNNFTAMAHNDPLAPGSTYIPFPRTSAYCSLIPEIPCTPVKFPKGNLPIAVNNALLTWKGAQRKYGKNLGLLRAIDLSSNTLNGEIPQQVVSLIGLRALNLSRNQLNGTIPTNIGQLELLESLDLSVNRLGGGLPHDLSKLSYLSYLNLSNNVLSGKIPSSTQLQSFNATSYIGNSQLCGPPLLNQCPGDETKNDDPSIGTGENSRQGDKLFGSLWFYTGLASGFTSGLLGVCGALLLNSSWRRAYFDFLTTMWDSLYVTTVVYKARFQRRLQELI